MSEAIEKPTALLGAFVAHDGGTEATPPINLVSGAEHTAARNRLFTSSMALVAALSRPSSVTDADASRLHGEFQAARLDLIRMERDVGMSDEGNARWWQVLRQAVIRVPAPLQQTP